MDFRKPYSREEYISFFKNHLLPEDFKEQIEPITISYQPQAIKTITKLAEVPSLELAVYEIEHQSENDPRVSLSRDAFRLLSEYSKQKALVIFTSEKSDNYRLSLITIDLKWEDGKRVKKEYSNPRRYSFFLGPDSRTHTPYEYLAKKERVKDFEDLKNRFSIEVVNKEFYTKIAVLFTQLAGGKREIGRKSIDAGDGFLKLPGSADDTIRKEFAVRLIGRLVFCWFLKKKKSEKNIPLIPEELLSKEAIFSPLPSRERKGEGGNSYYHKILEPLFFQVLNTPSQERNKEFKNKPWDTIPFLNGGLFNPHQHDYYDTDKIPLTPPLSKGESKGDLLVKVPDQWLTELFEVFETYNFTIDENTSIDVELAIEPEMLGRIFENLLAEINPETGETARKATGSYYTPRPIVEYMVDESLKQYLLTKTQISEEKLLSLLSYEQEDSGLTEKEKYSIIEALNTVKVIDPACGSGAFPMGVLQKILLILQKVDPDSKLWFEKKRSHSKDLLLIKELERKLKAENFNYIHKLGIIQSSIYGVDIQPIAVEISKLRFFLSLIVDEKVNDYKENRGIEPLPNLEFKFVCANSLIGLPKKERQAELFESDDSTETLRCLREDYLRSYGEDKKKIEEKYKEVQNKLTSLVKAWEHVRTKDTHTKHLSKWDPFKEEVSPWFASEWMFGIKDGFDIVIANPPYGADLTSNEIKRLISIFKYYDRQKNTASFFLELATKLSAQNGVITYIVPKSLSFSEGWQLVRNLISTKNRLNAIIDVSKAFEEVLLEQVIVCFSSKYSEKYLFTVGEGWHTNVSVISSLSNSLIDELDILPVYIDKYKEAIYKTIKKDSVPLSKISETFRGLPIQKQIASNGAEILRGKNIAKYSIRGEIERVILDKRNEKKAKEILKPKIISQNIVAHVINPTDRIIIMATLDLKPFLTLDTVMNTTINDKNYEIKYILALLNSTLSSWFYYWFVYNRAIRTMHFDSYYIGKFPIKKISFSAQKTLIKSVDKMLSISEHEGNHLGNSKSLQAKDMLSEIDQLIYEIYGLTKEEIKIIEGL